MIVSVILAAGEGSRMKSKLPKAAHLVCGKSIISYIVNTSVNIGSDKNLIIVGHNKDVILDEVKKHGFNGVKTVEQPIGEGVPYGTGYAVMQVQEEISDDDTVIILYGDTPLVTDKTLKLFMNHHQAQENAVTILTADIDNPKGYGRIIRNQNDSVGAIVEEKDANDQQRLINEINSGIYCFNGKKLKYALQKINNDNAQNEYYLTDTIKILSALGDKIGAFKIEDVQEIMGVNSRVQLSQVEQIMRKRINEEIMLNGVTMIDPTSTYIDHGVKIERDTIIYPGVVIKGKTQIGEDCIIGQNSRIVDSEIGDNVNVEISTIIESTVANHTTIGPYAYLRPNSNIGSHVKIGDFVEVKNSNIGDYSKASHLTYIGDADVGEKVNLGCGVVFVNYDGSKKARSIVKDNAFVGCNCNLVSPVTVEENAYIAAGSTITDDVQKDSLAIARARQINKTNWVKK